MENRHLQRSSRPVALWLLLGVVMIMVQVLLGGITRITGSGLSITEWKPIMGALPPMNEQEWNTAFEKYKQIAQFKYLNNQFRLSDFKFIFFWEWFHRLWARLIFVAFIIPFIWFIVKKRISKDMIKPMLILLLLGAVQGLVGWIMVMSGLNDSELVYVSHYKLAIHFIFALGLLCYAFWFALQLLIPREQITVHGGTRKQAVWLIGLLVLQLIYGAFMAGLKAANYAPTWPDINGGWTPVNVHDFAGVHYPGFHYLFDHPIVVHFIHRNLAYLITILIFAWWWKSRKVSGTVAFRRAMIFPPLFVVLQVLLGILTVLWSPEPRIFLWLGVAHQFVSILLLLSLVAVMYVARSRAPLSGTV